MGTRSEWVRTLTAALGLMSASLLAGCASEEKADPSLATRSQAAVAQVRVLLPAGSDISTAQPTTTAFMNLKDRSSIRSTSNVPLPLTNLGTIGTQVGQNVTSGSITSVAPVLLRSGTIVQGDVTSASTVTSQSNVTVTGSITQNATIPTPAEFIWDVPLAANPSNPKTINPDTVQTLAPGAYGKLTVYSRGRVNLSSGVYAFSDMQVEPDAKLRFDINPANGPVVIYTDKVTWMRGTLETTNASYPTAKSVLFVYRGTSVLRFERTANMAVVSPTARVELGTGGTIYQGSVFAQGLVLDPDVKLTYVPFDYWDRVLPARPFVSCVLPVGSGKYMAAFGFENSRIVALSAPHGPQNRFVPASPQGFLPPASLAPGLHDEAVWVDMPETGVTWELMGRTAAATLSAPACVLEAAEQEPVAGTQPSGHSLPSPSLPPAPSPSHEANDANLLGPGKFVYPPPSGLIVTSAAGPSGSVPTDPDSPLDIPEGLTEYGTDHLHLTVHATPSPSEHDPAGVHIGIAARIEGELFPTEVVEGGGSFCETLPCTGDRTYDLIVPVDPDQLYLVEFYAWEYNEFSSSEATLVQGILDPATGELNVSAVSGPTGPLNFGDLNQIVTTESFNVQDGDELTVVDYAQNEYRFTMALERKPTPPQEQTRVCADWTAYFVDTAIPGAPFAEGQPGVDFSPAFAPSPMPEQFQRLRGHDAAFASFTLQVRGPFASYGTSGHLDQEGCVAIPSAALIYDETAAPGSLDGGVALHMQVAGHLLQPTSQGDVEFDVAEGGRMALTKFGFNDFHSGSNPFPAVDGFRMPPPRIDVAGASWDHRTTVSATVSRLLQELAAGEIDLPATEYQVRVGEGSASYGVRDHLCAHVPDSYASTSSPQLFVGPGHFPCATAHGARTCDQECEEGTECASGICSEGKCTLQIGLAGDCRQLCSNNTHCPGGQHCAQADNVDEACDAGPCYCAWPGQGTMKYVTAHELGHIVQQAFLGGRQAVASYTFDCPAGTEGPTCEAYGRVHPNYPTQLTDPPGMNPVCGCQHVENSNADHCLQSVERTPMAQIEGYAQYFAAKIWNGSASTCLFAYYKEFVDAEGVCHSTPEACRLFEKSPTERWTLTEVPIPLDCGAPPKWRNTNGCGVDPQNPSATPNEFAQSVGTEYDWMTFLRGVDVAGIPFPEIMSIYNHACHPENQQFDAGGEPLPVCSAGQTPVANGCYAPAARCADDVGYGVNRPLPTYWFDRTIDPPPVAATERKLDRGGFLDGARRKWGAESDQADEVQTLGLAHGVDENVAP